MQLFRHHIYEYQKCLALTGRSSRFSVGTGLWNDLGPRVG